MAEEMIKQQHKSIAGPAGYIILDAAVAAHSDDSAL